MIKIIYQLKLLFVPCKENQYRPSFLRTKFLIGCILILFLLKIILISFIFYFPKSVLFAEINKTVLFNLTNEERQSSGLNSLKENSKLNQAAFLKAQDMFSKNYFNHQSPDGIDPWYWFSEVEYEYQYAGENLAIDFMDSEELYQAWSNSPSHRENIVYQNYKDIGIAVVQGDFNGEQTTVVVQLFGTPVEIVKDEDKTEPASETVSQTAPESNQKEETDEVKPIPEEESIGVEKSLYQYYSSDGQTFPSFRERANLYEKYDLGLSSEYQGTIRQNTALLKKLIEDNSLQEKEQETLPLVEEEEKEEEKELIEETADLEKNGEGKEKALNIKTEIEEPIFPAGQIRGASIENNSFKVKILNFMARYYNDIIQKIFLAVLLIVFTSLSIDVLVKVNLQFKDIVLRGVFYVLVLLIFILLDKEVIIQLIPHNFGVL